MVYLGEANPSLIPEHGASQKKAENDLANFCTGSITGNWLIFQAFQLVNSPQHAIIYHDCARLLLTDIVNFAMKIGPQKISLGYNMTARFAL